MIIGIIRQYKDSIVVNIQHISQIHSFDNVQLHFLNIIQFSLYKRIQTQKPIIQLPKQSNRITAPLLPTEQSKSIEFNTLWGDVPLSHEQERVLHLIQQYGMQSNEGVNIQQILQSSNALGLSPREISYNLKQLTISSIIQQLLSNGNIYNTVDNYHFKSTNLFYFVF